MTPFHRKKNSLMSSATNDKLEQGENEVAEVSAGKNKLISPKNKQKKGKLMNIVTSGLKPDGQHAGLVHETATNRPQSVVRGSSLEDREAILEEVAKSLNIHGPSKRANASESSDTSYSQLHGRRVAGLDSPTAMVHEQEENDVNQCDGHEEENSSTTHPDDDAEQKSYAPISNKGVVTSENCRETPNGQKASVIPVRASLITKILSPAVRFSHGKKMLQNGELDDLRAVIRESVRSHDEQSRFSAAGFVPRLPHTFTEAEEIAHSSEHMQNNYGPVDSETTA